MKYLLIGIRGLPHSCNGAQILPMDDKLHTELSRLLAEFPTNVKPKKYK